MADVPLACAEPAFTGGCRAVPISTPGSGAPLITLAPAAPAQDIGKFGRLYLSEAVPEQADLPGLTPNRYTVAGVRMTAFED